MPRGGVIAQRKRKPLDGHEERIKQLHRTLTFEELKETINNELGEIVPESQYKKKFIQLDLRKNRKIGDINVIACHLARMPPGTKVFEKGKQLSQAEIEHIIARSRPDIFMRQDPPPLPANIVMREPTPARQEDYTGNIPFLNFEDARRLFFRDPRIRYLHGSTGVSPQVFQMERNTSSAGTQYMAEEWNLLSLSSSDIQALGDTFFANHPCAISALRMILPFSDIHDSVSGDSLAALDSQLVDQYLGRQLLYSIANGFAGIDGFPIWQPFKLLQGIGIQTLNQLFGYTQGHTIRAIAQSLFKASIENGSHVIINAVLSIEAARIDVNREKIFVNGRFYTPVERASTLQHYDTIAVLIHHQADVDKSYNPRSDSTPHGALACAVDSGSAPLNFEAFKLLANATSVIFFETVKQLLTPESEREFLYLINNHAAKCEHLNALIYSIEITDVVYQFSEQGALDTFEILQCLSVDLKLCDKPVSSTRGLFVSIPYDSLLCVAARRGYGELYRKLVSTSGLCPGIDTLHAAVEGGNKLLVQEILSSEQLRQKPWDLDDSNELWSIATLLQNKEISDLLRGNDEIDRIARWREFEEAWDAAETAENQTLMNEMLKTHHANVDEYYFHDYKIWALRVACTTSNHKWAQTLLDRGADATAASFEAAIRNDDIHLLDLLLNSHCQMDNDVLEYCAKYGSYSAMKCLLEERSVVPDWVLHVALRRKDKEIVSLLLDSGADINLSTSDSALLNFWSSPLQSSREPHSRENALQVAAKMGDEQWVEYVISKGADPNDTYALEAAYVKNPRALKSILTSYKERYNRVVPGFGSSVLILAIQNRDLALIRMLLEHNVDPHGYVLKDDGQWLTPFGYAIAGARGDDLAIVTLFLTYNCHPSDIDSSINVMFDDGNQWQYKRNTTTTAFLTAISTENIKLVHLLAQAEEGIIRRPARRTIRRTAMQRAAELGSLKMVQLLYDMGAEINEPPNTRGGATSLQLAAIGGFGQIVCYLIDHGADVNAPGAKCFGMTALVGAASRGRIDTVGILLNAGAGRGENGQEQFEEALKAADDNGQWPTYEYIKERRGSKCFEDYSEEPDLVDEFVDISGEE
ncbi:ankyrin [Xylaria telfairii]|nr:ankyrin [Xylaria telfairii]